MYIHWVYIHCLIYLQSIHSGIEGRNRGWSKRCFAWGDCGVFQELSHSGRLAKLIISNNIFLYLCYVRGLFSPYGHVIYLTPDDHVNHVAASKGKNGVQVFPDMKEKDHNTSHREENKLLVKGFTQCESGVPLISLSQYTDTTLSLCSFSGFTIYCLN